jgi:hypothetical protein
MPATPPQFLDGTSDSGPFPRGIQRPELRGYVRRFWMAALGDSMRTVEFLTLGYLVGMIYTTGLSQTPLESLQLSRR